MIEFAECAFATDAIRKWRWRASEAKVALVSRIEYALKFETEPIPDHVAIRNAWRATTRAYQRVSVASFRMYALRPETWKIKNLEMPPPARKSGII